MVAYPQTLDFTPFLSSTQDKKNQAEDEKKKNGRVEQTGVTNGARKAADGKCLYDLHGVLIHAGPSMHCGHYYAFVKAPNSNWYKMDDVSVKQSSLNNALNQQAYILFYTKQNVDNTPKKTHTPEKNGAQAEPAQAEGPTFTNGQKKKNSFQSCNNIRSPVAPVQKQLIQQVPGPVQPEPVQKQNHQAQEPAQPAQPAYPAHPEQPEQPEQPAHPELEQPVQAPNQTSPVTPSRGTKRSVAQMGNAKESPKKKQKSVETESVMTDCTDTANGAAQNTTNGHATNNFDSNTPKVTNGSAKSSEGKSTNDPTTIKGVQLLQNLQSFRQQPLFQGMKVPAWDEEDSEIKQAQSKLVGQLPQETNRKNKRDREWDKELDKGRLKKIREKKDRNNSQRVNQKFQRVAERKRQDALQRAKEEADE